MNFLYIVILTLISLFVLFIITKFIGYRQISEMSFFDYVVGITIGSIAAETATNSDVEWWKGVTAMVIYGAVSVLLSFIAQRNLKARSFITGKPIVLIEKGKINIKALKKARLDVNDLLCSARGNGYFNLADVDFAIMETTGKISFQPTGQKRNLNPKDFNFAPEREGLYINIIMDGKIIKNNLEASKIKEKELLKMLKSRGEKLENIFLCTVNENKQLTIFKK